MYYKSNSNNKVPNAILFFVNIIFAAASQFVSTFNNQPAAPEKVLTNNEDWLCYFH